MRIASPSDTAITSFSSRKFTSAGMKSSEMPWIRWLPILCPVESVGDSFGSSGWMLRAETRDPPGFGISGQPAVNAVNFRGLVHADAHFGDHVRVFLQAGSWGQDGRKVPRIFDEAEVALQRAFADIRLTPEATLRLGRQDLFRSSSRLLFPVDIFNYQQLWFHP